MTFILQVQRAWGEAEVLGQEVGLLEDRPPLAKAGDLIGVVEEGEEGAEAPDAGGIGVAEGAVHGPKERPVAREGPRPAVADVKQRAARPAGDEGVANGVGAGAGGVNADLLSLTGGWGE